MASDRNDKNVSDYQKSKMVPKLQSAVMSMEIICYKVCSLFSLDKNRNQGLSENVKSVSKSELACKGKREMKEGRKIQMSSTGVPFFKRMF